MGRGRDRPQPALGRRALDLVADVHRAVDRATAPEVSGLSSPRSASACSRTPCCPGASARSRAPPCSVGACAGAKGTTATLIGSVFAHRMFDLFPTVTLVVWVLLAAEIPQLGVPDARARDRDRRAAVRGRVRARASPAPRAREPRLDPPGARPRAAGARDHEEAGPRDEGDGVPVRRVVLPAVRRVGSDERRSRSTSRSPPPVSCSC